MAGFSYELGACACTRDKCSYECETYRRWNPPTPTKADRIRAMTDEELAAYLGHASLCVTIQGEDGGAWCSQYGSCNECVRDWLKEEAVEAPAKDINVPGTYDILYEEGGLDTR